MTTTALPQIPGSDLLTNSRMACARSCLRKHYYRYELGIRRERDADALRLGSAFHLGLDLLAKGHVPAYAIEYATASYDAVPDWCTTEDDLQDWMLERETVARLLSGYAWRWQADGLEYVASELAFELPLINPDTGSASTAHRLAGKIDGIVRLPDQRLAVIEHKTTSDGLDSGSDYWPRLRLDQQISAYYLAAQALGYDVSTVLYDVVRKPSIRPRKITAAEAKRLAADGLWCGEAAGETADGRETVSMWGARLTADIAERPDFYYARQEITRLQADIAEFRAELWQQHQMLLDCRRTARWFRNTASCASFGRCEYLDICGLGLTAASELPPGFIRADHLHPELAAVASDPTAG